MFSGDRYILIARWELALYGTDDGCLSRKAYFIAVCLAVVGPSLGECLSATALRGFVDRTYEIFNLHLSRILNQFFTDDLREQLNLQPGARIIICYQRHNNLGNFVIRAADSRAIGIRT